MLFYLLGVAMSGKIYRCNPMFFEVWLVMIDGPTGSCTHGDEY